MKKKKSSAQGLPEYTGRYPKPKLRFRLRVVFFIFLSCLLIGLVFYLLGVNFDLFSYLIPKKQCLIRFPIDNSEYLR